LQGDGWTKMEIIEFSSGARDKIKGLLLSNSCDIASANPRDFPPKIVFAPLVPLKAFADLLRQSPRLQSGQVEDKLTSIRKQRITSLFYLPQGGGLDADHIAILDDLHSIPLATFLQEGERTKLFTLGQMGFYLFVFKLSIHFCRFHEGVVRS